MIRDVSNAKFIKDEPRGANRKSWLSLKYRGRVRSGLFKPTYVRKDGTNTQTHYGELIYSDICKKLLHFPCADIELAEKDGQIGCVSYNVLENIPDNNEDYTRYNLVDMVSIIQRIRKDFDASGLKIKGTQEYYSLDLLMEAIDNYIPDKKQNRNYKDYILYLCLIDSVLNYFDRHALNLAAAEERKTGHVIPVETFDNGTCLSLGIRESELEEICKNENSMQILRANISSRIGVDSEAPISFERLETLMFNHYFDEVTPFYEILQRNLTLKGVEELLKDEEYENLSDIHKKTIIEQIKYNLETMRQRYEKCKKRNDVIKIFQNETSLEESNKLLANFFENENFTIQGNILDEISFKTINNIKSLPKHFEEGLVTLSPGDKSVVFWTILITNIMKKMDPNLPNEAKKALLKDFLITEFNFYPKDLEKIEKLVDVYYFKLDEDTAMSVRKFIFGSKNNEGLGEENVKPFIALKLAESENSQHNKERYNLFIKLYGEVLRKEQFIEEYIPSDYQKNETFKKLGITDPEEITLVLYSLIDRINEKSMRFSSNKEFYDYLASVAKEVLKDKKVEIEGVLIDKEVKEFLEQHTYKIQDGKKITIITEPLKNSDVISYLLGASYFVSIGDVQNGEGRKMIIAAKEGEELPDEVIKYAEKIKQTIIENTSGNIVRGDFVMTGINKKQKKNKKTTNKSGALISIASGSEPSFSLKQTSEELRKIVLDLFKIKQRNI